MVFIILTCFLTVSWMLPAQAQTSNSAMEANQVQPAVEKGFLQVRPANSPAPQKSGIQENGSKQQEDKGRSKEFHKEDKNNHDSHESRHSRNSPVFYRIIPPGFKSVMADGQMYYYNQGVFYRLESETLVPTEAPIGAIVDNIPTNRSYETFDEVKYSIYNNVYYVRTSQGKYQVVEPPDAQDEEITDADSNAITVNVPNSNGKGYSSIVLIRTQDGFIGPQEEFYTQFPSVSQLKARYGRQK